MKEQMIVVPSTILGNIYGSFDENSYSSGDAVNSIKWSQLDDPEYKKVQEYYAGLMELRRLHPAFRLSEREQIDKYITAVDGLDVNVLAFDISGEMDGESADRIFVIFNPNEEETTVELPEGKWKVFAAGEKAQSEAIRSVSGGKVAVEPVSAMILMQGNVVAGKKSSGNKTALGLGIGGGIILIGAGVALASRIKKKQ